MEGNLRFGKISPDSYALEYKKLPSCLRNKGGLRPKSLLRSSGLNYMQNLNYPIPLFINIFANIFKFCSFDRCFTA